MTWTTRDGESCSHLDAPPSAGSASACEDCVAAGTAWVHLRTCTACGHVGCCDSSPERHATAHHRATSHPVVASAEPGERWGWCYEDEVLLVPA